MANIILSLFICFSCTALFVSISQVIGCEDRLQNDLYCVEWGVKLYSNQAYANEHRDPYFLHTSNSGSSSSSSKQLPVIQTRKIDFLIFDS